MIKKLRNHLRLKKALKSEKKLHKALKREARVLSRHVGTEYDNPVISWTAPEYVQYKKGKIWYTVFSIIFIGAIVAAYFLTSWTFSLALLVFMISYLIAERRHPKNVRVIISEMGIKVGNKIYQYNRIRAFWIYYHPPMVNSLNIRVHNEFLVDIEIQLAGQNPVEVYNFLSQRLPELEGKSEGFFRGLFRLLKL